MRDAKHDTPQKMAALLKEPGYDGISCLAEEATPEMFRALDECGLKMTTITFVAP